MVDIFWWRSEILVFTTPFSYLLYSVDTIAAQICGSSEYQDVSALDADTAAYMAAPDSHLNGQVTKKSRVVDTTFAGRLGGNQEFIAGSDHSSLLKRQPDAIS